VVNIIENNTFRGVLDFETISPIDYTNNEPKQEGKASLVFNNNVVQDLKFQSIFVSIKVSVVLKNLEFSGNLWENLIISMTEPLVRFTSS
jgi:hypothetical protein